MTSRKPSHEIARRLVAAAVAAWLLGLVGTTGSAAQTGGPGVGARQHHAINLFSMLAHRMRFVPGPAPAGATVVIRFTLNRAGNLVSADIHRSSGDPAHDMRVLGVLLASGPFPPIPPEIGDERLTYVLPIRAS